MDSWICAVHSHRRQRRQHNRDLAPKNVFVRYDGQVRVADFGSALATKVERADAVVGTLGYMSPEQARLEPLDARSDVYAAGLILYELVTGQRAFDLGPEGRAKKDQVILKAHQKGQMEPIPSDVPDDIRMIIEIACSPDREDRYASARDNADADEDPVHADEAEFARSFVGVLTRARGGGELLGGQVRHKGDASKHAPR